ncbi:hypothetical protein EOS_33885 [Caballeronia mineralivorans PML1(12)]|uniref:Uncharacterized protein n=1 Tax=Caballeronia mineralivorans PML1(12) TaxID=908627 RepID=A0A0J1CM16_9BURK|nr:class II aldolase/adducin family protein [Caballeronia mineralivorans]KLU21830.1 hypothetical protein EOS_33885 [Caballeronia mineralivorans PML1(12)]
MDEHQLRTDFAAAFRCFAHLGMHEAVANHFSAAVSPNGRRFLMNRKWQHFSRIRDFSIAHFEEVKCMLDKEDASYAQ